MATHSTGSIHLSFTSTVFPILPLFRPLSLFLSLSLPLSFVPSCSLYFHAASFLLFSRSRYCCFFSSSLIALHLLVVPHASLWFLPVSLYLRSVIDRIKSFLRSAVIRKKSPFFLQILPLSPRVMLVISTTRICSVHLLREKKSNTPQSTAADALICIAGGFFYASGADWEN